MKRNIETCILMEKWTNIEKIEDITKYQTELKEYYNFLKEIPITNNKIQEFYEDEVYIYSELENTICKLIHLYENKDFPDKNEISKCKLKIYTLISDHQTYESSVKNYENEKLRKLVALLIIVLVTLILIMLLVNLSYFNTRKEKEAEQKYKNHILKIQETERKHLSHELHDTIAQDLRSLKFLTSEMNQNNSTDKKTELELISRTDELAEKIISNIRYICYNLTPPELECKKISDALGNLCYSFSQESGISCPLVITDKETLNSYSINSQTNIFRTIQEALENIKKHSKANEASIIIRKEKNDFLQIIICDDGIGFDVKALTARINRPQESHFGIFSMTDRIETLGGSIAFNSSSEIGTEIKILIPLEKNNG